jgi:hypothetical protein
MAVDRAQINLADLLAGRADETQPRMTGRDGGADPQVKSQLAAFCAPNQRRLDRIEQKAGDAITEGAERDARRIVAIRIKPRLLKPSDALPSSLHAPP